MLSGVPVVSISFTRAVSVWEFPRERFVEYEEADESWCRALGIGREVERAETLTCPQAIGESAWLDGITFRVVPDLGLVHPGWERTVKP